MVALSAEKGERLFNCAVCRGRDATCRLAPRLRFRPPPSAPASVSARSPGGLSGRPLFATLTLQATRFGGATLGGNHRDNQTVVPDWYKPW